MENCGTDARRLDVFYHLYAPRPSWRRQNQYTVTLKEQVSLPGLYKEVLNCKSGLLPSRWRRQNLLPKTWTIWCASWVFSAFSQCSDCNTLHGRKHLFCLLYGGLTVWLILPPMLSVRFMVDMKIEQSVRNWFSQYATLWWNLYWKKLQPVQCHCIFAHQKSASI